MSEIIPEHLEPYRELVGNTGGNSIENLIGRLDDTHLSQTNQLVFTMAISVEDQVNLLKRLHAKGWLSTEIEALERIAAAAEAYVNHLNSDESNDAYYPEYLAEIRVALAARTAK